MLHIRSDPLGHRLFLNPTQSKMQRLILLSASALLFTSNTNAQSFSFSDFSSLAGLNTVLEADTFGTVLRVQDNVASPSGGNMGAAWYNVPVAVVNGFETTFEFSIIGPGNGDGMAFVIQNDQIAGFNGMTGGNAIGRHASACGYGSFPDTAFPGEAIDNALVFEIDHVQNVNQPATLPILDPDGNHISIHTGGTGDCLQQESMSIGRAETAAIGFNLDNGVVHEMRVVYVPGSLEVFLNGNLVISVPYNFNTGGTLIDSGASVGGLDLIGGTSAWIGFTGGGAGNPINHDIHSWSFESSMPVNQFCEAANPNSTGVPVTLSVSPIATGSGIHLDATGGPTNQAGFFLVSTGANIMAPISQGLLCLDSPQGRYNPAAGGALNSLGLFNAAGDLANIAGTGGTTGLGFDIPVSLPNPPGGSITSGSTWHFQLWYRDTNPGTVTNFSNGVSVTF